MTVETKFNIGDEVHFIENNSYHYGKIVGFLYEDRGYTVIEYYSVDVSYENVGCSFESIEHTRLFKTKEELIDSLFN